MPETLGQLRGRLRENLDDKHFTGFDDARLNLLLNESLQWLVNLASTHDYFFRIVEYTLNAVVGTNEYAVDVDNVRRITKIERSETDWRWDGTLIHKRQRNDDNARWSEPIMYQTFKQITGGGAWRYHLAFRRKNQPAEVMTILVTYAPEMSRLVDDADIVVDIDQDFMDLLVLRATIMGYGGEKNADKFWLQQWQAAQNTAMMIMEDSYPSDEVQFVRQIANDYS